MSALCRGPRTYPDCSGGVLGWALGASYDMISMNDRVEAEVPNIFLATTTCWSPEVMLGCLDPCFGWYKYVLGGTDT